MDVGGTFTDVVLDDGRDLQTAKVPSTPRDQARGVLEGLDAIGVDVATLERFVHGTTVTTNTVLERSGARTVLVVTEGFRDLLEIGRQTRPKLYDLFADRPAPLVPRDLVVEVAERVAADGSVLRSPSGLGEAAARAAGLEAEAVAVCLLFSFLHPEHERAVGQALSANLSNVPASLSCEVLPVFREYERASTTALNAYVTPVLERYLSSLAASLAGRGLQAGVEIMRSGGGTLTAGVAERLGVHTLLSGPAAGAWGAAAVGAAAGFPDVIAFDMGGTSTDATLVDGGRPRVTSEGVIDGLPFSVPSTEIHTVGAGGGSIAWRDAGGALRVGPRSAGADPGPACYGKGGTEPTVTDAYVVGGVLGPSARLGGSLALQPDKAGAAIAGLAGSLGMEPSATAAGVLRVLEAQVAKALRVVSVERGRDPRRYALLAFGGAGPIHQAQLARELGCEVVLVPRHPGVLSALGLLAAPVSVDAARTVLRAAAAGPSWKELAAAWGELEREVRVVMARQSVAAPEVVRTADCRYLGQAFELEVPAPPSGAEGEAAMAMLRSAFERAHRERYGYHHPGEPIEVVTVRVRAEGPPPPIPSPDVPEGRGAGSALTGRRAVLADGMETECGVFDRSLLGAGDRLAGPAIVEGLDATCFVAGGQAADVDGSGNLIIREG